MLFLTTFKLINVIVVHLESCIGHSLFPSCEGVELFVSIHTVLSTVKEFLCKLESSDKHQPRVPTITFANISSLLFKPFALCIDKFQSFGCSSLVSELNEVIAHTVTTFNLIAEICASENGRKTLSTSNPSVVATTHQFSAEHIQNTVYLCDLLLLSTLFLISLDLFLCIELINQVLILIDVIFSDFEQVQVNFLVCGFFPAHECNSQSAFILINKPQIQSL